EWLLAMLFDRLKVSSPKALAWMITFAVAAEAFIVYATTNDLFGTSTFTDVLLAFFAGIIALGAGAVGTRTTRHIKQQQLVAGKQFLFGAANHLSIAADTRSLFIMHKNVSIELGVDNVKLILADFLVVVMAIRDILRELSFRNILSIGSKLLELLFLIQSYIANISLAKIAWEELKDMDEEEAKLVRDHLQAVYEDTNEELEIIVDEGFELIPAIQGMVQSYFFAFKSTISVWNDLKAYKARIDARSGRLLKAA
ncbi:MAG: hypothetical protein AAF738_08970, partial [Bacteroidota bacterium]